MASLPNIVPVSDFRKDAARILDEVRASSEPTVVTQRGRAAAVMVSVAAYEQTQADLAMLRALLQGEQDIARGDVHDGAEVFAEAEALLRGEAP